MESLLRGELTANGKDIKQKTREEDLETPEQKATEYR